MAIFSRSLRLPQRRPGASRPALLGAVRAGAQWFPATRPRQEPI
ncbi:hypothetical protein OHA21_17945 [Actinoplanes sp. NBC_00393]